MATLTQTAYLLEHDWEQEPRRLKLLEDHADPTTIRRLQATGVAAGWRCLEVGAGRGSIAHWLCQQVGAAGHVTALDLDTSLLDWLDQPNLDVVGGDVLEIELPKRSVDLIHTRLVLMHIPERQRALERIISWLAPGGWLVVEELDWMAIKADTDPGRVEIFSAYQAALPTIDFECGRALLAELKAAGLTETTADVRLDVVHGATPRAQWDQLSMLALTDQVLDAGTATPEQIDAHITKLDNPDYTTFGWAWVGASGRRR
jgi:SAM-dependent methyltransferase